MRNSYDLNFSNYLNYESAKNELLCQFTDAEIKHTQPSTFYFSKLLPEKVALRIITYLENKGYDIDRLGLVDPKFVSYIKIKDVA